MAFDVSLRDGGSGTFDVSLSGGGGGPAPSRHLAHLLSTAGVVALGFFAADAPAAPKHNLHALRAPAAEMAGHGSIGVPSVVLVEGESRYTRTDHSARLLQFRAPQTAKRHLAHLTAPYRPLAQAFEVGQVSIPVAGASHQVVEVAAQPTQPWFALLPGAKPALDPWGEWQWPAAQRHSLLPFTQPTTQPSRSLALVARAPALPGADEVDSASRAQHGSLHRFRFGYQTVGQPVWTITRAPRPVEVESLQPAVDLHALHRFRAPAPAGVGQPWFALWPRVAPPAVYTTDQFVAVLGTAQLVGQPSEEPAEEPATYQPLHRAVRGLPRIEWEEPWPPAPRHDLGAFRLGSAIAPAQPFGVESVDLTAAEWADPWRRGPGHPLQPFRQYTQAEQPKQPAVAYTRPSLAHARPTEERLNVGFSQAVTSLASTAQAAAPGQPFALLRAPRLPSWTEFERTMVVLPRGAATSLAGYQVEAPEDPGKAPFAEDFVTLNEPQWAAPFGPHPKHQLQPFRQYAPAAPAAGQPWHTWKRVAPHQLSMDVAQLAPATNRTLHDLRQAQGPAAAPPCAFAVESVDLNGSPWTSLDIRHPSHSLLPFRFYRPAVPGSPYSLLSFKAGRQDIEFERDFRVPQYSLYPFRVGLYVPPVSYPAQGVGGFIVNMGTFMRR